MSRSLILSNSNVIRSDGSLLYRHDIVIRDGVIQSVLPSTEHAVSDCHLSLEDMEVYDCSGCFVTSGLVNLHTHSPMTVLRGIAEDVSVDRWFNEKIWPFESILTPEDIYVGAKLAIYEMLDCGVTAFCDHYFFAEKIVDAAMEAGIRADIAPTIFGALPDWGDDLDDASILIKKVNDKTDGRVKMSIGPHAPYTCPPAVLAACTERAIELKVGTHIHVSETYDQVQESIEQYGKTPFVVLKEVGMLDIPCIIGHGIWIQEEEVFLLGEDSVFAVCPKTYLKLSSGFGNLYKLQWHCLSNHHTPDSYGFVSQSGEGVTSESGVQRLRVGIGTDGAGSSNTLNPIEQVRLYGLLAKHHLGDASAFPCHELWRMLMNGYAVLDDNIGEVAPTYIADLVVWDLATCHTWPVYDPLAAIIYSADARNVRDVLVEGEFKKKAGKVLICDEEELLQQSGGIKERLLAAVPQASKIKY